jgi:hypothetical protein
LSSISRSGDHGPPVDERAFAADALRIFTFMWAVAVLFHQASYNLWVQEPSDWLLTVAALFTVLRPSSLARLTGLLVAQVWATWEKMPEISNHWLLAFVMALTMLLALAVAKVRARSGAIDRAQVYLDIAPALRLQMVMLYAWAAFHKLNRDYFDPQVSCAAVMANAVASQLPFVPNAAWAQPVAIAGSILVESAIPLFFCVRRLRWIALLVGAGFHIFLVLSPYPSNRVYNFSALLLALYFLFAPFDLARRLDELWAAWNAQHSWLFPRIKQAAAWGGAALVFVLGGGTVFRAQSVVWHRLLVGVPVGVFLLYACVLVAALVLALRGCERRLHAFRRLFAVPLWLLPACLLVFLNGLSPYVGLKTETSFAMYSNLRTEGGATNHFVIRRPWRLAGFQEDLVTFVQARNSKLRSYAENGYGLTWFEFRHMAATHDRLVVTYRRQGGPERSIQTAADDPELAAGRWPPWMRKLLWFRPVKLEGPVECLH